MLILGAWQLLWLVSLAGYGWATRRVIGMGRPANPVGVDLVLGMLLISGVGGTLMFVGVARPAVWVAVVTVGVVLCGWRIAQWRNHVPWSRPTRRRAIGFAGVGLGSVTVMFVAAARAITHPWNACDDDLAYLYLVRRIWFIGDLDDPFNNRRLVSSGLGSLLQSLSMGPIGENALHTLNQITGSALLVTLALAAASNRNRLLLLATTLILTSIDPGYGQVNSSPTLLLLAIGAIALYEVFHSSRAPMRPFSTSLQVVVLSAGLLALIRPYAGLALAVFAVWLALTEAELRPAFTMRFLAASVMLASPWLAMGVRDVHTPLFPVFSGVANPAFPLDGRVEGIPIAETLRIAGRDLLNSRVGLFLVVCLVMVLCLHAAEATVPWRRRLAVLYGAATVSSVVFLATLTVLFRRSGVPNSYVRFWVPILLASGIAVLYFSVTSAGDSPPAIRRLISFGHVGLVTTLISVPMLNLATDTRETVVKVINGDLSTIVEADRYASVRADYESVRASIEPRRTALTAVNFPHLLLARSHHILTLDIPGANAPRGRFPVRGSFDKKLEWLRRQDVDLLIVHPPSIPGGESCLYSREPWLPHKGADSLPGDWEPSAVSWFDFVDELLAAVEPVTQVGRLVVFDVRAL